MGNFTVVRVGWGKLNRRCKVSNGFFFGRRIRPRGKEPDFYSIRRFLENLSILRAKKKEICGYFFMNLRKNCFIFFATLLQILIKC